MELTDKKWKAFKIADLFHIEPCKCGNASLLEDGDDVFYRGAKKSENGVMRKVKRVDNLISDGNCIMFICDGDGSCGYTNYIADDFIGSTTTSVGYNDNLNRYTGPFVVSVLDMHKYKYSHSRKYRTSLANEVVMLPVDDNGNPDWDWIEQYMKSLEEGLDSQMNDIMDVADGDKNIIKVFADKVEIDDFKAWLQDNANMDADHQMSLDDVTWGTFKLTDVFTRIEPTKGKTTNSLEDGNDVMYIAAAHNLQGFNRFCSSDNVEDWISKGNCIIFVNLGDGSAGYANYMGEDFIGMSGKTSVGYIDGVMTPNIGKFLETILCQERFRYGHERSWAGERLTNTKIQLPVDDNGNPDWDWIEQYMKSLPYSDKETEVA